MDTTSARRSADKRTGPVGKTDPAQNLHNISDANDNLLRLRAQRYLAAKGEVAAREQGRRASDLRFLSRMATLPTVAEGRDRRGLSNILRQLGVSPLVPLVEIEHD